MVLLISFLAFSTVAIAAPLSLVTPDTLINDIGMIDKGVLSLTGHLQTYQGGLLGSAPILADITAIHLANRKGLLDANIATPANSVDSNRVVDYTFATVGVDIPNSVEVLKGKKAAFDAAGLTTLVEAGLVLLKYDHDTFSAALLAKISSDALPRGQVVVKQIDDALQNGLDYYAS
ncbi:hypothetical protein PVAG01_09669 [Phlyctema vagabunda]|uniref:Uncharacterized protein n=1 Tax=Phlyctema vagabunda TaxID=108571 RepID=A0ABR4P7Z9_9HELO